MVKGPKNYIQRGYRFLSRVDLPSFAGIYILFSVYLILFNHSIGGFFFFDVIDYLAALFWGNNFLACFKQPFISPVHFRPLEAISFLAGYHLFGLNAGAYLTVSLLISTATLAILYYLLLILFKNKALSFLACLLVAMHPAHIQRLGLVVFSSSLLFLLFFSTLLLYFLSQQQNKKNFFIFALVVYTAAVFTKEEALTLPLFILVYHLFFDRPLVVSRLIKRTAGFFLIAAAYLFIRFLLLGLWLSAPDNDIKYNFFNFRNTIDKYKLLTTLALHPVTNTIYLIMHLHSYIRYEYFIPFNNFIIFFFLVLISFFIVLHKKEAFGQPFSLNGKGKIFLFGISWYSLGLFPFIFIKENAYINIYYLLIPLLGLAISMAIMIAGVYQLICRFNRQIASGLTICLLTAIFLGTLLTSRRIAVYDTGMLSLKGYFGGIDCGDDMRKYMATLKKIHPVFPAHSQIFFVGFEPVERIEIFTPIYYNDTSLRVYLLSEDEFKKSSVVKENNIFIFKLLERGRLVDLTPG
jgi:hypothetical protein